MMLSISMAFHLSTKGAEGIIVGRAVATRRIANDLLSPASGRKRPPSGGGALIAATCLAIAVKLFLADLAVVDGRSMEPYLSRGSLVLVLRCAYGVRAPGPRGTYLVRWGGPSPGDLVLAFPPATGKRVVKRVSAGDPGSRAQSGEVFAAGVYLRGDNPAESRDSREYGPVRVDDIAGRVIRLRL